MKFGVTVPNYGKYASKTEIVKIAQVAEELGFDSIWVSDHVIIPNNHKGFGFVFYDPFITLSYIASLTKNIKLGTSVAILPYRNPIVLAKMISTLDNLSDGRIILGVGTGWLKEEFDALGIAYEKRGEVTDEILKVLKILWTEDNPSYKGNYYNFSNIKFLPKPLQKPHPAILVGGGTKKSIERSVEFGQGWHPVGLTPKQLNEKMPYLNSLLENHKNPGFEVSLRRTIEITNKDLSQEEILRGSVEKIIRGIKEYKKIGVDNFLLHFLSGTSEGVINSMKIFSKEIKPLVLTPDFPKP